MTVPAHAKYLLDCIGHIEAPQGYDTVYGNRQRELHKPLTQWTVAEIIGAKPSFTARFRSSACGKYQFMRATLQGLVGQNPHIANYPFTPTLQDSLGYMLLQRRGYDRFVTGQLSIQAFGKALAQEWASFPVLAMTAGAHRTVNRGQSYYAGDGMNKALVPAQTVETWLATVLRMAGRPPMPQATPMAVLGPVPAPEPEPEPEADEPEDDAIPTPQVILPASASGSAKGIGSSLWALLQGKPPVPQAERKAVTQEARAELPHILAGLSGLRWAGIGTVVASAAGGAQDSGLLSTVQGTADQATQTFQSVQTLVNLVLGLIRWGVTHWWVFGLVVGFYMLAKVGWAVYGLWMQVQQWRTTNATLDALKSRTGG